MLWRKGLTGFLIVILASPVWGGAEALGNITASNAGTVRGTKLTPGSTVFSGDEITVGEHGATRIALASGAQAEVLGNSRVRLTKTGERIQMAVDRGQASFHTSGSNDMEALVADASVRPADGSETSVVIQSLSVTHAVIAAEKGTLLVTTAHGGKTYTVREGDAADLSVAPAGQQTGGTAPAGKTAPPSSISKKKVAWIVVGTAAATVITAYVLARNEATQSTTTLQNEISPTKPN
jgi:hypothetical protein